MSRDAKSLSCPSGKVQSVYSTGGEGFGLSFFVDLRVEVVEGRHTRVSTRRWRDSESKRLTCYPDSW